MINGKIFKGILITSQKNKSLKYYNPGFMAISDKGIIEQISDKNICSKYSNYDFYDYSKYLIIPGFIDAHNHVSQYSITGLGKGELLSWLENYTFPVEKRFNEKDFAKKISRSFFKDLIKNGTTTISTFPTVFKSSTDIVFNQAEKSGIRAVIGKVMMDQNCPDFLKENTLKSIKDSEELIEKWHKKNKKLFYASSPRFAITCSFKMLKGAARLREKYDTYLQTHLAENKQEIVTVKKIFPKFKSYLDVYKNAGMLGEKSLMVHCIYLNENDLKNLEKTKTKIVHCPTANTFMCSGIMNYRKYLDLNLDICLGTDVGGGYSLSMLEVIKQTIECSKILSVFSKENFKPITLEEAFYSATLGGAKCLSLQNEIGSLDVGKEADFLIIDLKQICSIEDDLKPFELLSKCVYNNNSVKIKSVYVQGENLICHE